jgi:hypothetical protein
MNKNIKTIETGLLCILGELETQPEIAAHFPNDIMPYNELMQQLHEWITDAGEYGIAYESIVSLLEIMPFKLSGQAAVKLLEVGLLFGYKTTKVNPQSQP